MSKKKLIACLLNISEGRNVGIVEKVLHSTVDNIKQNGIKATILNVFSNQEYNRTVISISGEQSGVKSAIITAALKASNLIDMENQEGTHPRLGAVDLIPLHPLTETVSLEDCAFLANDIAKEIILQEPRVSFFLYGSADTENRGLINRRKQIGWFEGEIKAPPDLGDFHPACGITGIGTSYYMTNFNIIINTTDMKIGTQILKAIREKTGGFKGVSAMAFHYQGGIEIACNVDMFTDDPIDNQHVTEIMPGVFRTKFSSIQNVVERICKEHGTSIRDNSMVIGFTPEEAARRTEIALNSRIPDYYKLNINEIRM